MGPKIDQSNVKKCVRVLQIKLLHSPLHSFVIKIVRQNTSFQKGCMWGEMISSHSILLIPSGQVSTQKGRSAAGPDAVEGGSVTENSLSAWAVEFRRSRSLLLPVCICWTCVVVWECGNSLWATFLSYIDCNSALKFSCAYQKHSPEWLIYLETSAYTVFISSFVTSHLPQPPQGFSINSSMPRPLKATQHTLCFNSLKQYFNCIQFFI